MGDFEDRLAAEYRKRTPASTANAPRCTTSDMSDIDVQPTPQERNDPDPILWSIIVQYDFDERPVDKLYRPGRSPIKIPRRTAIAMQCCVRCAGEAELFKDELSERDYAITGLCQKCQDWVYQEEDGSD